MLASLKIIFYLKHFFPSTSQSKVGEKNFVPMVLSSRNLLTVSGCVFFRTLFSFDKVFLFSKKLRVCIAGQTKDHPLIIQRVLRFNFLLTPTSDPVHCRTALTKNNKAQRSLDTISPPPHLNRCRNVKRFPICPRRKK